MAAKFFSCRKLNVTSVTPAENPIFNAQNAPVVVLVASNGSVVTTLSRRITASAVLSAMLATMRKSGISTRAVFSAETILKKIATLEDRKAGLRVQRAQASRNRAKSASAEQKLKVVTAQLEDIEKALASAYETWKKLLATE